MSSSSELRDQILALVAQHAEQELKPKPFVPGQSKVPVSGRIYGPEEVQHLVSSGLDFWLTAGRYADTFEKAFAALLNRRYAHLVNSGSSANLVAVSALTSKTLGDRQLQPGDEVITVAAGFPTTVAPILQNGLVPVFVDVDPHTYNALPDQIEAAIGPRTRAIMLAHTLGNPFDLGRMTSLAKAHDLWLIEDSCDALGSTYAGQPVGSFGDIATFSFYPAHHITMGEGGAVVADKGRLSKLLCSFRDWGRDCWCPPGQDNTCGKRFGWSFPPLPKGYDHKYIYSHLGYNLKVTDMQAAVGVAQLQRLPTFIEARKRNFQRLSDGLGDLTEHLALPQATENSDPAWFGFPIRVRSGGKATRNDLVQHLEQHKVATRLLFGGDLRLQPAFADAPHRVPHPLPNTDDVVNNVFWVGVYPGITDEIVDYMIEVLHSAF